MFNSWINCTVFVEWRHFCHPTWQKRRRRRRWWSWEPLRSQQEDETESQWALPILCVKASVCCSDSGSPRSNFLWGPQRSDKRQRSKMLMIEQSMMIHSDPKFCLWWFQMFWHSHHRHTVYISPCSLTAFTPLVYNINYSHMSFDEICPLLFCREEWPLNWNWPLLPIVIWKICSLFFWCS